MSKPIKINKMKLQESKLIFVPSHNDFDKEGIVATKEMLDYGLYPFLS